MEDTSQLVEADFTDWNSVLKLTLYGITSQQAGGYLSLNIASYV